MANPKKELFTALNTALTSAGFSTGGFNTFPRVELSQFTIISQDKDGSLLNCTCLMDAVSNANYDSAVVLVQSAVDALKVATIEMTNYKLVSILEAELTEEEETTDTNNTIYVQHQRLTIYINKK